MRRSDTNVGAELFEFGLRDAVDGKKVVDAAKRPTFYAELNDRIRGIWAYSGQRRELLSARCIQVERL